MEGKRIAIALENDGTVEGTVSAHFGRCPAYGIWRIANGTAEKIEVVSNPYFEQHVPGAVPGFIRKTGANVMIAGGMGPRAIALFNEMGIEVVTGALGNPANVMKAYVRGELSGIVPCRHDHEDSCGRH